MDVLEVRSCQNGLGVGCHIFPKNPQDHQFYLLFDLTLEKLLRVDLWQLSLRNAFFYAFSFVLPGLGCLKVG